MTDALAPLDPDLGDVQGTILRGYRVDHARHFVLQVVDPAAARHFLGSLVSGAPGVPQITTAARWTTKPRSFLNVGITYAGLEALGVAATSLATFPESFQLGATNSQTAETVGDVGDSAPWQWVAGLSDGTAVHVLLSVWAHEDQAIIGQVSAVLRAAFATAMVELGALDAAALPDNKVHFGYTDNISQPTVQGAPPTKRPRPDNQPVAPTGEFLMGYESQNGGGQIYSVEPEQLSTNSSFAAFRVLEQDVAGFEQFLVSASAPLGIDPELVAAKVCGRWRNGVPLVLSPDTPTPTPPIPPEDINNYDYVPSPTFSGNDTSGYSCPIGSHMRRCNPRGERVLGLAGHLHRIVRRAMPYGPPYDPAQPDDAPRGLVGYFITADIQNQFEFLMGNWVNQSNFVMAAPLCPGQSSPVNNISGQDVILGANTPPPATSFTLPLPTATTDNKKVNAFSRFVTTRGGAYCYLPSITALKYLERC